MVSVVQLVEHRIVVPSVVGSSPITHPSGNFRRNPEVVFLFWGFQSFDFSGDYTSRCFAVNVLVLKEDKVKVSLTLSYHNYVTHNQWDFVTNC